MSGHSSLRQTGQRQAQKRKAKGVATAPMTTWRRACSSFYWNLRIATWAAFFGGRSTRRGDDDNKRQSKGGERTEAGTRLSRAAWKQVQ
jgi:hypothetical protein